MLVIVALVLLGIGFYAFIGTSSRQATEMLLAGIWAAFILMMVAGVVISLFG